jgi:hypothetical protein
MFKVLMKISMNLENVVVSAECHSWKKQQFYRSLKKTTKKTTIGTGLAGWHKKIPI